MTTAEGALKRKLTVNLTVMWTINLTVEPGPVLGGGPARAVKAPPPEHAEHPISWPGHGVYQWELCRRVTRMTRRPSAGCKSVGERGVRCAVEWQFTLQETQSARPGAIRAQGDGFPRRD